MTQAVYSIDNSHDFDIIHVAVFWMTLTEHDTSLSQLSISDLNLVRSFHFRTPPTRHRFHPTHKQDDTSTKFCLSPTHPLTKTYIDSMYTCDAVNGHRSFTT